MDRWTRSRVLRDLSVRLQIRANQARLRTWGLLFDTQALQGTSRRLLRPARRKRAQRSSEAL